MNLIAAFAAGVLTTCIVWGLQVTRHNAMFHTPAGLEPTVAPKTDLYVELGGEMYRLTDVPPDEDLRPPWIPAPDRTHDWDKGAATELEGWEQ